VYYNLDNKTFLIQESLKQDIKSQIIENLDFNYNMRKIYSIINEEKSNISKIVKIKRKSLFGNK
jgi:hypothetical protein